MTLDDLPVGACWPISNGVGIGILLEEYKVLYTDSKFGDLARVRTFKYNTSLEKAFKLGFIPVELV